ncbi:MAG: amidohydrolase family protein [Rhodospirillales bacterium]|jgi:D-galactarolactone isomerase
MFNINNLTEDYGRAPKLKVPPKSCDTHSHVYGPLDKFQQRQDLESRFAPVDVYRNMLDRIGIERCVIVHSSFYGFDNSCSLDAIAALGPDRARGTCVIPIDTPKSEMQRLHDGGMRGVRVSHGADDLSPENAADLARLVAPFGWILQFQDKRSNWIADNASTFAQLPVPVVFDHFGRTSPEEGVKSSEFKAMVKLVEKGNAWVKISGAHYSSKDQHPGNEDMAERLRILIDARPDRLIWALNWPFPDYPFESGIDADSADFLDQLLHWEVNDETRTMILATNPGTLFGFDL